MISRRWLIFDIGGVVVRLNAASALAELAERSRTPESRLVELFQEKYSDPNQLSPHEGFQIGKCSEEDYLAWLQSQLVKPISISEIRDIRLRVLDGEDSETCALIRVLSGNHDIACFSNTHTLHWSHMLEKYPIFREFKLCLASHIAGVAKPFREAYQFMCDSLSAKPENCVFIDDGNANVAAAEATGMKGILFRDAHSLRKDLISLGYKL